MAHVIRIKSGEVEVFETFDGTAENFQELVAQHMGDDAAEWFSEFYEEYLELSKRVDELEAD